MDSLLTREKSGENNIYAVLKRHNKTTTSKVGKDLDRLDDVLRENAEKAVEKTPVFNTRTKYYEEWDGVHDSEGC